MLYFDVPIKSHHASLPSSVGRREVIIRAFAGVTIVGENSISNKASLCSLCSQRGLLIDDRLSGAFVSLRDSLSGISRTSVWRVMTTYIDLKKAYSAKQNSGRNLKLTDRDSWVLKRMVGSKMQDYSVIDNLRDEHSYPEPSIQQNGTAKFQRDVHAAIVHNRIAIPKPLISAKLMASKQSLCWSSKQSH